VNLSPENKIAGILTPLFALRSEKGLGIGDVATLREFIVWARETGFGVVQLLPINEVGRDNSPYNAISAMAIEPMTLHLAPGSPAELMHETFESVTANENLTTLRRGPVKYERVRRLKRELLEHAFKNFQLNATADRQTAFEQFCERESSWLKPYSFFRVLMELNSESETWDEWKREHRDPQAARSWLAEQSTEMRARFSAREKFFSYVQWIADEQWRELRKFAEEHWAMFPSASVITARMFSLSGTSSISIGRGARRRNHISKMTSSRSSGDKTGGSRFITGRRCARRISPGGDSGCAA